MTAPGIDPEARLSRKSHGHEAKLAYQGHVLMENRHGLVMDTCVSQATGLAERETAIAMTTNLRRGATVGANKGYDTRGFVAALRSLGLTPHVVQNAARRAKCDRWPDHPPRRIPGESAEAEACGRDVRVDEDGGAPAEDAAPGRAADRVAVHPGGGALQPGADPQCHRGGGGRMSGRQSAQSSGTAQRRGGEGLRRLACFVLSAVR